MGEGLGVLIAIASSALGGTGAAVTRYLVSNADPITLATLRWGIGIACVLPTALVLQVKMPPGRDLLPIAALGFCFFGVFFILYNIAVSYTTAARASLALSTLPLQTMILGALLGTETLTKRKTIGVCVAVSGGDCRPRDWTFHRTERRLAGGVDYGGRGTMHGILQRLV